MKKTLVMMMVVLMVAMCAMSAMAELTYRTDKVETFTVGTGHNGKKVTENVYHVFVKSDSGEEVRLEVTEKEYNKSAKAERDAKKSTLAKVGTALSFWNPND